MTIDTDEGGGRMVGSKVRLAGEMMGLRIHLEEVVTDRVEPIHKAWQTTNARLVVIGNYRLGFDLAPEGQKTRVRVYIDYELPKGFARILGKLFGRVYARWCVDTMVRDASRHFAANAVAA